MLKIRRIYNQNKKSIWLIIGIIVFLLIIIRMANYFAGRNNQLEINQDSESIVLNNTYSDLSVQTDKSVLSQERITSTQFELLDIINVFYRYCNEENIEKAYNMLSNECKEVMYPNQNVFEQSYYNQVFNSGRKEISIESWTDNIYKVDINEDSLVTGVYNQNNNKQEYVTVVEDDNGEYKLNINSFIGRTNFDRSSKIMNSIEMKVLYRDTYIDYEIYTFEIFNDGNGQVLVDPLRDIKSMYIKDSNDMKYYAYTHELSTSELTIRSGEKRTFKVKYYSKYIRTKKIESITFNNIIPIYITGINLDTYNDYRVINIDL